MQQTLTKVQSKDTRSLWHEHVQTDLDREKLWGEESLELHFYHGTLRQFLKGRDWSDIKKNERV